MNAARVSKAHMPCHYVMILSLRCGIPVGCMFVKRGTRSNSISKIRNSYIFTRLYFNSQPCFASRTMSILHNKEEWSTADSVPGEASVHTRSAVFGAVFAPEQNNSTLNLTVTLDKVNRVSTVVYHEP